MKNWKRIFFLLNCLFWVVLMWIVASFTMAVIFLICFIVAEYILEICDLYQKNKKFELIEIREANLYRGVTGVICIDKESKMYELGGHASELNLDYHHRNISKKSFGTRRMIIEEVVQVVEEGEKPYVEIHEWKSEGILLKKVHKQYKIIIPLSSLEKNKEEV